MPFRTPCQPTACLDSGQVRHRTGGTAHANYHLIGQKQQKPGKNELPGFIEERLDQGLAGFVSEAAAENDDQVNQGAYAEQAGSEQPENAGARLAHVEAVNAKAAEEEAKPEGSPLLLVDVSNTSAVVLVIVGIDNIDCGLLCLLGSFLHRYTAVNTHCRFVINLRSAVFTIHSVASFLFLFPLEKPRWLRFPEISPKTLPAFAIGQKEGLRWRFLTIHT